MKSVNPLDFPVTQKNSRATGMRRGKRKPASPASAPLGEYRIALAVLNSFFMMGNMGSVVGEKITRLVEKALSERMPLLIFCCLRGAGMQEGIFSLMQMAKTGPRSRNFPMRGFFTSASLTNPTTGECWPVLRSWGRDNRGTGALIGFAGKRVIQQTIKQELPSQFPKRRIQLEKGFVDMVVSRGRLREVILRLCVCMRWKNGKEIRGHCLGKSPTRTP